jgi:hypothetical protein
VHLHRAVAGLDVPAEQDPPVDLLDVLHAQGVDAREGRCRQPARVRDAREDLGADRVPHPVLLGDGVRHLRLQPLVKLFEASARVPGLQVKDAPERLAELTFEVARR